MTNRFEVEQTQKGCQIRNHEINENPESNKGKQRVKVSKILSRLSLKQYRLEKCLLKSDDRVFVISFQLFKMLHENSSEVCEAYTYDYINSLTEQKESLTRAEGINLNNALSLHLKTYVKQQLNNPNAEDSDLVAEDEPAENSIDPAALLNTLTDTLAGHHQNLGQNAAQAAPMGKTKKDKEKALKNGELHDYLVA